MVATATVERRWAPDTASRQRIEEPLADMAVRLSSLAKQLATCPEAGLLAPVPRTGRTAIPHDTEASYQAAREHYLDTLKDHTVALGFPGRQARYAVVEPLKNGFEHGLQKSKEGILAMAWQLEPDEPRRIWVANSGSPVFNPHRWLGRTEVEVEQQTIDKRGAALLQDPSLRPEDLDFDDEMFTHTGTQMLLRWADINYTWVMANGDLIAGKLQQTRPDHYELHIARVSKTGEPVPGFFDFAAAVNAKEPSVLVIVEVAYLPVSECHSRGLPVND